MKLTILILALALTSIMSQQPEGYDQVGIESFYTDDILPDLVDFGSQYVIEKGILSGNLPDTEYFITQIYGIYKQKPTTEDQLNYAFDVLAVDLDGSSIRCNFLVTYYATNQSQEVTSFAYDEGYYYNDFLFGVEDSVEDTLALEMVPQNSTLEIPDSDWIGDLWFTEEQVVDENGAVKLGGKVPVDLKEFNEDPEAQELLLIGLEEVLEEITPEEMGISQFHVTNVNNMTKQVVNGLTYTFDVDVESSMGTKININIEVYTQPWTGEFEVLSYTYDLTNADGTMTAGEEIFIGF